ncbi:uncharacterized protein Z519_09557 [Cladophialophora bantiana CBS 173.52]|uniref:Uncharacterized protein n=1 Tax=Cladophialophora bantiana (strain ATCC 10958 / CBS 173.52 / CDC B-1940 / NIH 8579) TaxID=1442370 RepID=A0A0D2EJA6_CLAB1|nr:uncharacterized protein Z519_09557 [Cladophialophora bantiana CBS 173.52]KIW90126.1 hypothetical protein Z519_09557 [Cladophialophora bantiana CBS 173.52]
MVLSLITLAATVPLIATSTIQLQEQSQRKQEESELELKTEKCHLSGRATKRMSAKRQEQFQDMRVVLDDGYLFLEPRAASRKHPFTGYLLPYPDKSYDGIVSTINAENMLNWIFVNKDTYRLQHGIRAEAQPQWTGPVTLVSGQALNEWRIAFNSWEGFVAVEEDDERWAIYFDKDDNGLAAKVEGKAVVEIELVRTPLEEEARSDEDPD